MGLNPYRRINIILAGVILLVFIYSGLFTAERSRHPFPSFYEKITGEKGPSSGMSRAFSELIRGNLASARSFNEDSPLIFTFFLVQFIQRFIVLILLIRTGMKQKTILVADIAFSLCFFLYCFKGQIVKMAQIFTR